MPRPLHSLLDAPPVDGRGPHNLDLEDLTAGTYFTIGRHAFMAARMNLTAVANVPRRRDGDPMRDLDEVDLRLVHAWWRCPND